MTATVVYWWVVGTLLSCATRNVVIVLCMALRQTYDRDAYAVRYDPNVVLEESMAYTSFGERRYYALSTRERKVSWLLCLVPVYWSWQIMQLGGVALLRLDAWLRARRESV